MFCIFLSENAALRGDHLVDLHLLEPPEPIRLEDLENMKVSNLTHLIPHCTSWISPITAGGCLQCKHVSSRPRIPPAYQSSVILQVRESTYIILPGNKQKPGIVGVRDKRDLDGVPRKDCFPKETWNGQYPCRCVNALDAACRHPFPRKSRDGMVGGSMGSFLKTHCTK